MLIKKILDKTSFPIRYRSEHRIIYISEKYRKITEKYIYIYLKHIYIYVKHILYLKHINIRYIYCYIYTYIYITKSGLFTQ